MIKQKFVQPVKSHVERLIRFHGTPQRALEAAEKWPLSNMAKYRSAEELKHHQVIISALRELVKKEER